ncbi:MAG: hypothetical protein HW421_991 [Ignavibacteria bacterium]|nr:hypothetical protein [Ignavibacteria bacterium]
MSKSNLPRKILYNGFANHSNSISFRINRLLIILNLFLLNTAIAAEFDLMPLNINYFGVVASGKNIIAYGDNGAYLMTTDRGNTWKQYSLNENGEIRCMVNYNDTLLGILDNGYMVQSFDNGFNWIKSKFALDNGDKFLTLVTSQTSIYIRSINSIYQFDKKLKLVNSFTDTIIKVFAYPKDIEGLPPVSYDNYFMAYLNEQLLISVYYKYYGLVTLSNDLTNLKLITLKDKMHHWNPEIYSLVNVLEYNNKPVFNISGRLYYSDNNFTKWTYFYQDTNILNPNDPYYIKKYGSISTFTYKVYKNKLLISFGKKNQTEYTKGFSNINNFGIKEFDSMIINFKEYNNIFDNRYYTNNYQGGYSTSDGISSICRVNNINFIDDSIIVIAGYRNTLLITTDNANSWKLVSYLSGKPKKIINDSTFLFFNDDANNSEVNRTNDYGNTFIPTEIPDSVSYLIQLDVPSLFYMDDNGKGFIGGVKGGTNHVDPQLHNYNFTKDGGKTYKSLSVKNNLSFGYKDAPHFSSKINNIDGNYLFALSSYSNKYFGLIYIIDSTLENISLITYDTLMIHQILADDLKHFIMFTSVKDKMNSDITRFEIHETQDTGKTYKTILSLEKFMTFNQFYEHNKDSVFISCLSPARLYLYDRKRNTLDTLLKTDKYYNARIMYLGGKFYIVGDKTFLENTDRSDLTKWQPANWDWGVPTFESVIFKGNLALAKLSDDVHPLNYYKIMVKEPSLVIEQPQAEKLYYQTKFYAYPPIPLPARNTVKTKVLWDLSYDIKESIKGVYNIYGVLVSGKENISVNIISIGTAEFVWDCYDVPSGIYFIVVDYGGKQDCVPIVVEK